MPCIQYAVHISSHCALHRLHMAVYNAQCIALCSLHVAVNSAQCIQPIQSSAHCAVYTPCLWQSTMHTSWYKTMHNAHTLHKTAYKTDCDRLCIQPSQHCHSPLILHKTECDAQCCLRSTQGTTSRPKTCRTGGNHIAGWPFLTLSFIYCICPG